MANQPESAAYETGIFQLETTTPVLGGVGGPSNLPLLKLANRTAYLKQHVDDIEAALPLLAPKESPDFTGTPQSVTPPDGDDTRKIPTTEWVRALIRGQLSKAITGGNITLTAIEAGRGTIILTGTLTSDAIVNFPASAGRWIVVNRTTGAFTVTIRPTGGAGLVILSGRSQYVYIDGTNLFPAVTEAPGLALTGIPTADTAPPTTGTTQVATTAFARRFARGVTQITVTAGGTFTLTDIQAAAPIIVLFGTPAAGVTIVLPGEGARWTIANTTGQAATCKTAAQSGGVVVSAYRNRDMWADGGSVIAGPNELEGVTLRGTSNAVTPPADANDTQVITAEWVRNLVAGQAFYSTGDTKLTFKVAADTGWVMLHGGTIGNAASGASAHASSAAEPLFTLIWNVMGDAFAPVSGGRGASAAADFAAGKRLTLPDTRGRSLVGAGAGAGLTTRFLGQTFGAETVTLDVSQMPGHSHGAVVSSAGSHNHGVTVDAGGGHDHTASIGEGGWHGHAAGMDVTGGHTHSLISTGVSFLTDFFIHPDEGTLHGGTGKTSSSTTEAGWHAHNIWIAGNGAHSHAATINAGGAHAHTASTAAAGNHQHAITSEGGGAAHSNVQPSIALNVMVKL